MFFLILRSKNGDTGVEKAQVYRRRSLQGWVERVPYQVRFLYLFYHFSCPETGSGLENDFWNLPQSYQVVHNHLFFSKFIIIFLGLG